MECEHPYNEYPVWAMMIQVCAVLLMFFNFHFPFPKTWYMPPEFDIRINTTV